MGYLGEKQGIYILKIPSQRYLLKTEEKVAIYDAEGRQASP